MAWLALVWRSDVVSLFEYFWLVEADRTKTRIMTMAKTLVATITSSSVIPDVERARIGIS